MNSFLETLLFHLQEFEQVQKQFPGPISHSVTLDFQKHSGHLVFGSIVHGNEVGSLPAITRMAKALAHGDFSYGGKVSFFLGNVPAAKENKRYLEYDLNRCFGETQADSQSAEYKRALDISMLLKQAHVFIDFHQTILATRQPFYIFPWHDGGVLWARALGGASTLVTRKGTIAHSSLGACTDDVVRACGYPAITIELGMQGWAQSADLLCELLLKRALSIMDGLQLKGRKLSSYAQKNDPLHVLINRHKELFVHPLQRLKEGFQNFDRVHKGDVLGFQEKETPLICPMDGYLLFPKYPNREVNGEAQKPWPGELFYIVES